MTYIMYELVHTLVILLLLRIITRVLLYYVCMYESHMMYESITRVCCVRSYTTLTSRLIRVVHSSYESYAVHHYLQAPRTTSKYAYFGYHNLFTEQIRVVCMIHAYNITCSNEVVLIL